MHEIRRIDYGKVFQNSQNVFQIGGNKIYDRKNGILIEIPAGKRSGIGIIAQFRGIPSGFPNQTPACPDAKTNTKRKASGGSNEQVPKKAHSEKFCQHCKAHGGPYQTHNTLDCCCYDSNSKPLAAAAGKPSESKKSRKKFGGDKSMAFMQTMFKAYVKAKKAG